MKVQLKRQRDTGGTLNMHQVQCRQSLPFFKNSRGLLIHRVKSVTIYRYRRDGEISHYGTAYLCGNQTTAIGEFLSEPPASRLVCAACEHAASKQRLPSADEIVGRHVHVGRIRVERTCCEHTN